ncbi:MAG: hypothetical protein ACE5GE_05195 [Phycisphaerae bacterium]
MQSITALAGTARWLLLAVCCLVVAPPVFADDAEDLNQAIQQFQEGNYLSAQQLLLDIDPDGLTDAQRVQRDNYVDRVQVALSMVEKAANDLEDAEQAVADHRLDEGQALAKGVLANEYAKQAIRSAAVDLLRKIGEMQDDHTRQGHDDDGADNDDDHLTVVRESSRITTFDQPATAEPVEPRPIDPHPAGLIDAIRAEELIKWQRTVSQYREAERQIRELVIQDRYPQASQALLRARQVVEAGRQYADPLTKYESLKSEANALANFVEDEQRRFKENQVARQRAEVLDEREARLKKIRATQQRQIDMLMEQAFQLRKDRDFRGAIDTVKQVIALDPANGQAKLMLDLLEDLHSYTSQRQHVRERGRQARDVLRDVEETMIPWHDDGPKYPADWLEIISSEERGGTGQRRLSQQDLALNAKLDQAVAVNYEEATFEEVVDDLSKKLDANLTVLWPDLENLGIDRDTEVSLQLTSQITFKKALEQVLEIVGGTDAELSYVVSDGLIKVASKSLLDRDVLVEVYDIRDLLMVIPDFTDAPEVDLSSQSGGGGGGGGGGGQGEPIFSDDDDGDDENEDEVRDQRIEDLLFLIRDTIQPDTWRANGGQAASVTELNGQLVVTQTASGHEEVASLLNKLREQQTIQVAVESRFITVQSNFLEELGIDLDVVLNAGNAGFDFIPATGGSQVIDPVLGTRLLLPRSFSRLGFTPAVPGVGAGLTQGIAGGLGGQGGGGGGLGPVAQPFGSPGLIPGRGNNFVGGANATPIPIVSNILQLTDPAQLNSDLPGSFAGNQTLQPALNVFGSFLDNIQVDFLIRATQADARSTVLTAPRLVLVNGQRSWVAVVNQQSFVSQLQPVVASGAAAQAPQTGIINTGAVLDVRATVSADRRYVTMTLRPGVGRLLDIQTFLFTTGPNVGAGASGFIQLPSVSRQAIKTTVSVPDGGTLLIGGQKLSGEIEVEAGVPVLSKIPILKRLYSSRTLVKDEQVLLILVKPRILIQKESEQQAFPSFRAQG